MKARVVKAPKLACCAAIAAHALVGSAHAADDAVARVSDYLAGVKTLSASFVQVVRDREGRITERATGDLSIARPGRFRWNPFTFLSAGGWNALPRRSKLHTHCSVRHEP